MIPRYGMVLGNSKQYKCLFINSYFVLFHTVSGIPLLMVTSLLVMIAAENITTLIFCRDGP